MLASTSAKNCLLCSIPSACSGGRGRMPAGRIVELSRYVQITMLATFHVVHIGNNCRCRAGVQLRRPSEPIMRRRFGRLVLISTPPLPRHANGAPVFATDLAFVTNSIRDYCACVSEKKEDGPRANVNIEAVVEGVSPARQDAAAPPPAPVRHRHHPVPGACEYPSMGGRRDCIGEHACKIINHEGQVLTSRCSISTRKYISNNRTLPATLNTLTMQTAGGHGGAGIHARPPPRPRRRPHLRTSPLPPPTSSNTD